MNTVFVLLIYIAFVNLLGFYAMYSDKLRAKKRAYRIPETTFFALAIIGGCPGCMAGMYLFRHKTKHPVFVFGLPLILILQIIGIFLLNMAPVEIKLL